jgi:ribosomal protein S18 acetylase RimI-like enzyme
MNKETDFNPDLEGHSVQRLTIGEIESVQSLLDQCLDFMLLVDGHAADLKSTEEDFLFVPDGKSPEDKFVYGIFDPQNALVGLLDTLHGYPDESIWWIGLLLLAPQVRSQGLGQKLVEAFAEYALTSGAQALMLGVVEDNERAYKFWSKMGFEFVRQTEPQQFGEKTQRVSVMQKELFYSRKESW